MNLRPLLAFTVSCASFFAGSLRAESLVADLEANYISRLTMSASFGLPETTNGDGSLNSASKRVTVTVGNRDLLQFLLDASLIAKPMRGWKIVARTTSTDAENLGYRLYAVKTGQPDFALDEAQEGEAFRATRGYAAPAYRLRSAQETILSGGGSVLTSYYLKLHSGTDELDLYGIATFPFTFKAATLGESTQRVLVPGTVVLKAMGDGVVSDSSFGEFPVVVQGSVTISGHRITGLRAEAF